jgi:hypothetical protein
VSPPIPIATISPVPPVSPSKSLKQVEFPLKEIKSVAGIISYLTLKHGENIQDRGIVTMTSKSVDSGPLRNVADITSNSCFWSENEPGGTNSALLGPSRPGFLFAPEPKPKLSEQDVGMYRRQLGKESESESELPSSAGEGMG